MYSGGLDTSCMLKWIQDTYGAEIVTFTADLGQEMVDPSRFKAIEAKAEKAGAPNLAAWHDCHEALDAHLRLAFFKEFKHRLVDQWAVPFYNPPEGKVAHKKICPNHHCAGKPDNRQGSME